MVERKSRGAYLMGLMTYSNYEIEDQVNFTVYVPKVNEDFLKVWLSFRCSCLATMYPLLKVLM